MANTKFSDLTAATTPLTGSEVLAGVQSSANRKVSADSLWRKSGGLWVPPASASAYDDEFNAGTLDAKWTTYGTAATTGIDPYDGAYNTVDGFRYMLSQRPGWLSLQASSHNSAQDRGIYQASMTFAANTFSYIRVQSAKNYNTGRIALQIDDAARLFLIRREGAVVESWYVNGGPSTRNAQKTINEIGFEPEYIGIARRSTVCHAWVADAGGHWQWFDSFDVTLMTAPTVASIWVHNATAPSPGLPVYNIDFFRYQASATPPMP